MFASSKTEPTGTTKFVRYFYLLFIVLGTIGCTQQTDSDGAEDLLKTFSYKIIGQTTAADGSPVMLLNADNSQQQFTKAEVVNGQFVLEGELSMAGFYAVRINDERPYTLFLETNKTYNLKENNGLFTLTTTSGDAMDFVRFTEKYQQREKEEKLNTDKRISKIGALKAQLPEMAARKDGSYEKTVDELDRLSGIKPYNLRNLYVHFILDSAHRSSLLLPYFFKYVTVDQDNFKKLDAALQAFDATLQHHPYYKFAREKVDRVKDFYENMPVFPSIMPMNVQRDSLRLMEFSKASMLIAAFWKASNKYSVADMTQLHKKEAQLRALGVEVIYFSLDNDMDTWTKASASLGLGPHNYYLNANDRAAMERDFGVDRTPGYLWIDPQTRRILSLAGEDPALPQFINKVREFLNKH